MDEEETRNSQIWVGIGLGFFPAAAPAVPRLGLGMGKELRTH